jgi:glycogen debranching enzyme
MADSPLSIDIRHPLMLKANELVLLTREDGEIPLPIPGFGLFYRDTCYLAHYALRLHGAAPMLLMSADGEGIAAQMNLTNSHLATANGRVIADHKLSLRRTFLVLDEGPVFIDTLKVSNFSDGHVTLPLSLAFATTFESMFVLRGSPVGKRGQLQAPTWVGTALRFAYHGADDVLRTLLVTFSLTPILAPITAEQSIAHFELDLAPRAMAELMVTFRVDERPLGSAARLAASAPLSVVAMREAQAKASAELLNGYARIETASQGLGEVLARSLTDIALLEVRRGEHRFTTAGMPWFVGLFGRDSLLPTIQCLAYNPALGARTAKALAHWQGSKDDPFFHGAAWQDPA